MKTRNVWLVVFIGVMMVGSSVYAQKMGYINSQKIIASYKEAQDTQERLNKINSTWEEEGKAMQKQFQEMGEQLESQSLLLSEERKREKQQELQSLYMKIQQFQAEKWGQGGEFYKKQEELMQPIFDKINQAIKKVAELQNFDYVFDTVAGNIVYASPRQVDLTEEVIKDLEKGLESSGTTRRSSGTRN
ncbi:OmpH family outer membrane protein [bacterium]|nr:OmpH family outer membrane protein [bacterium]